jgi:catalase
MPEKKKRRPITSIPFDQDQGCGPTQGLSSLVEFGELVLDRDPENYFAEAAFHPKGRSEVR